MRLHIIAAVGVVLAALSTAAEARVFMRNAESCGPSCWANTIDYLIDNEPIAGGVSMTLSGQKEIQPPDEFGGFVLLWGCIRADGSDPSLEVTHRTEAHTADTPMPTAPNCEKYRLLGTWGRYPDEVALIPQEIHDRDVTFSGDFTCNSDLGQWFTGGHVWIKKAFTFCVPLGLAEVFYVRGEARRADGRSGLAQINFAQKCEEGTRLGGPTMQMRAQVKGASINGEPVSLDNVPIHISQTTPEFCIYVGPGSEGVVLSSGYRLASDGHSRQPVASRPQRCLSCWLSQTIGAFLARVSSWLMRH